MESELVRTELDGHVCIITLHRRDKRNAFDLQLTTALNEALDRFCLLYTSDAADE